MSDADTGRGKRRVARWAEAQVLIGIVFGAVGLAIFLSTWNWYALAIAVIAVGVAVYWRPVANKYFRRDRYSEDDWRNNEPPWS